MGIPCAKRVANVECCMYSICTCGYFTFDRCVVVAVLSECASGSLKHLSRFWLEWKAQPAQQKEVHAFHSALLYATIYRPKNCGEHPWSVHIIYICVFVDYTSLYADLWRLSAACGSRWRIGGRAMVHIYYSARGATSIVRLPSCSISCLEI